MRKILFLFSLPFMCALLLIVSCTKTNNVTTTIRDTIVQIDTVVLTNPANPIVGTWAGVYYSNSLPATDSFAYIFYIRPDSTIETIGSGLGGGAGYADGKWTLQGTAFSATINTLDGSNPENVQNLTATYNSTTGVLSSGIYTDVFGTNHDSGTFTAKRVP